MPGDPRNTYLPWMEWAGPDELLIQHMNRRQNADDLLMADATTGAVRTVLAERDSAWVDLVDGRAVAGRRPALPVDQRARRLAPRVLRSRATAATCACVTPGAFDAMQVEAVDAAGGLLYFIASPANATQRYLYRSRLDGTGAAERVTPAGATGTHGYDISPDARWALHTASSADTPPARAGAASRRTRPCARWWTTTSCARPPGPSSRGRPSSSRSGSSRGVTVDGWT